jgi:hypothetical protein
MKQKKIEQRKSAACRDPKTASKYTVKSKHLDVDIIMFFNGSDSRNESVEAGGREGEKKLEAESNN